MQHSFDIVSQSITQYHSMMWWWSFGAERYECYQLQTALETIQWRANNKQKEHFLHTDFFPVTPSNLNFPSHWKQISLDSHFSLLALFFVSIIAQKQNFSKRQPF